MATATPWQLANAGQVTPVKPVQIVIFSHGTIGWPYQTQQIVATSASYGSNVGVYGVNTGMPADAGGGSGGGSTGGGGTGGGGTDGGTVGGATGGGSFPGNAGPGSGTGGGSAPCPS